MSQAVKTPRVSPCEPLCAQLGDGWRVCPTRGDSARTGRIPGRHKNGEYAVVTCGRPAFQRHESRAEGSDTAPAQKCRKNAKREFLSPPPTGLPPKPSEAVSVGRGRATERASPAACGGTRDSSSARTTASIAFVWSAAKPLPCQMHWAGHGPAPHFRAEAHTHSKLRAFCGNAFTRLRRRSFKGGPVPL